MRGHEINGSRYVKRNHVGRRQELRECQLCGEAYDLEEDFLKHIRYAHKLSQAAYFQKYHPRCDKHTGEIILFKSREFYFDNDFNDKKSLKAWLVTQSLEDQQAWCREALVKRKEEKGLIYTPCQLELRTAMIPSANYLNGIFGNYYKVCEELGYVNKYKPLDGPMKIYPVDVAANRIVIDTREQKPLMFTNFVTYTHKLDEGDYGLEDETISAKTRIERKSLADFYGTLSKTGYERFVRELDRVVNKGVKLVVLVECPLDDVYKFQEHPQYKTVRATPEYILHQMRELIHEFPVIQFLFVKNRYESAQVVETLLQTRGEFTNYDLQLCYDTKLLI